MAHTNAKHTHTSPSLPPSLQGRVGVGLRIDWLTILIYLILLALGWMSICGACYDYGDTPNLFALSTRSGMQIVWIATSILIGTILLLLDDNIYDTLAYIIYIALILLLAATPFLARDIKGSHSWIKIGSFSLQSAEFAKAATALAIAKFMSSYGFQLQGSIRNAATCLALILLPMALIILQHETGSALVFFAFFLMLYREGMPGSILFAGIAAVVYFVVGIRYADVLVIGDSTSLGTLLVFVLVLVFVAALLLVYTYPHADSDTPLSPARGSAAGAPPFRSAIVATLGYALGAFIIIIIADIALAYLHIDPTHLAPDSGKLINTPALPTGASISSSPLPLFPFSLFTFHSLPAGEGWGGAFSLFSPSHFLSPFNAAIPLLIILLLLAIRLIWIAIANHLPRYAYIALFALGSIAFFYSAHTMLDHLADHQRTRVLVMLGLKDDPAGAGYNVIQAQIAIGSGGLEGKGFLNGTQTKLKYVPEQETDFIFCTVGEEQGFIGSAAVLFLFLALLLRLLHLAERQPTPFGRVYIYSTFSIFLFHILINVGMVLGLMPVIGIPLPFFSYGGSSLWGFTILLFIALRIDAARPLRP